MENIINTGSSYSEDSISTHIAENCDVTEQREDIVEEEGRACKTNKHIPLATTMMLFAITSQLPHAEPSILQENGIHSFLDQSITENQDAVKIAISRNIDLKVEDGFAENIKNKVYINTVYDVASKIKQYLKNENVTFELSYFHSFHEDYEHALLTILGLEELAFEEKFDIEGHIVEKYISGNDFEDLSLVVEVS